MRTRAVRWPLNLPGVLPITDLAFGHPLDCGCDARLPCRGLLGFDHPRYVFALLSGREILEGGHGLPVLRQRIQQILRRLQCRTRAALAHRWRLDLVVIELLGELDD